MNIDKIFNMFEPEVKPAPEDIVLVDFKDHPYYWVGMFKKIMLNYNLFSKKFISLLFKILDILINPSSCNV
jgi:hypothetical protein